MLLSERFAYSASDAAKIGYPPIQRKEIQLVREKLDDGSLQLIETQCPCGSEQDLELIAEKERYDFNLETVVCGSCGTLRFRRYLTDESLAEFYRKHYQLVYGRLANLPKYYRKQHAYGKRIYETYKHALAPGDQILEVGCGAGGALNYFRTRGLDVFGCEYSRVLVDHARNQGMTSVFQGSVFDLPMTTATPKTFKLIYIHHVFEHVSNPRAVLEACRALLADDGYLIIGVPDVFGIDRHPELGFDLLPFFHLAHKYNFTTECFEALAWQSRLQYTRIELHKDYPTPWSTQPELWGEFRVAAVQPNAPPDDFHKGAEMMRRLNAIEREYRSIRRTRFWPVHQSKARLTKFLKRLRTQAFRFDR